MKQYMILCASITSAVRGKVMVKCKVYNERHFAAAHIADLISANLIKEVTLGEVAPDAVVD